MRGGDADLLLLDGRVVLRDHDGIEYEERVFAEESIPAGGAGVFRADDCAATGGGEDPESANAAATESRGAGPADADGDEGNGGAGGGGGIAGGTTGDRGKCRADVFWGIRGN